MTLKFVKPPERPHVNVLLYGAAKSGKTAGACSGPDGTLLLNLDLENAAWYAHSQDPEGRIMELRYEGLSTLIEVADVLGQGSKTAGGMIETIVVDPLDELYRRLLDEVSENALRKTLPQYGDAGTYVERFCRALCEAPVNVVLVCHEGPVKNEATGVIELLPLTGTSNPALGQKLMGMVDVIGYTARFKQEDGTVEYVAQLVTEDGRRGGDRFDCLDDEGKGYRKLDLTDWLEVIGKKTVRPKPAAEPAPKPAPKGKRSAPRRSSARNYRIEDKEQEAKAAAEEAKAA